MKMLESAPLQLGSLSGKSCPISGRLSAPRIASTMLLNGSKKKRKSSVKDDVRELEVSLNWFNRTKYRFKPTHCTNL
jgi:hypothetical protein